MVHPSFHSNTFTAILTVLLAAASITPVQADPTPTSPGPGDVFIEGQSCSVAWLVDTTGVWTTTNIYLMTGDNYNMVRLATVGTVDGTDPTKTTYSYPCPQVSPHAAIYFYEFSSPASANLTWTTRFTVTDSISNIVPAPQSTQPGGPNIPWGVGTIVGTSASGSGSISSPVLPSALSAVTSICPPTASMTDSRVSPIVTTPTPIPSTNCTTTSPGSFSPPAVPSVLSTVTSLPPPTVSMTDSCVSSFVTIVTSSMAIFSTTVSMTDSKVSSAHTIGTTSTPLPSTTSMTTSNGANIDVPPGLLWRAVFSIGVPIFGFAVMFVLLLIGYHSICGPSRFFVLCRFPTFACKTPWCSLNVLPTTAALGCRLTSGSGLVNFRVSGPHVFSGQHLQNIHKPVPVLVFYLSNGLVLR